MSETSQKASAQRRKYPSLNLEQAVERARVLLDRERYNATPIDVIAKHWGFKSIKTGPASTAYSAVKQFGLLDETGAGEQRKAAISHRARAILTAPSDVRDREIREAALEPAMNRLIWERYGANTGSPESFKWHLISEMGFSDTGAREFAKQYEATLRFAGLTDAGPESTGEDEADEDWSSEDLASSVPEASPHPSHPMHPVAPTTDVWTTESGAARHEVPVHHAPTSTRTSRHAIPLIGGKQVILEGEFPLTEAAWEGFMVVLGAFKPGLVESEPAAGSQSSGGGDQ